MSNRPGTAKPAELRTSFRAEINSRPVEFKPSALISCCSVPRPELCNARNTGLADAATDGGGSRASTSALVRTVIPDWVERAVK